MIRTLIPILYALIWLSFGCDDQRLQSEIDREILENHFKANNIKPTLHSSGMFYIIHEPGTGSHPAFSSLVTVKFRGYLLDGTVFEQTPDDETVTFSLPNTIAGWQYAVPLLKSGGKGTFWIPSSLAYGRFPPAGIPANSNLVYDIELIRFR